MERPIVEKTTRICGIFWVTEDGELQILSHLLFDAEQPAFVESERLLGDRRENVYHLGTYLATLSGEAIDTLKDRPRVDSLCDGALLDTRPRGTAGTCKEGPLDKGITLKGDQYVRVVLW
jgi:hypothetical protein